MAPTLPVHTLLAVLRRTLRLGLLAVASIGVAACGDDDGVQEARIVGDTLTVYSSVPLRGPLEPVSRDIVAAQKLALAEAGGRAGRYDVSFAALDSANPETGSWDPGRVASNARRAVQDRQTIAYLGELETGASAVSLPILNEGGILQVSPRDTFAGLTEPGARGEPDNYYPSGVRTFTRVVPRGDEQARLLVAALRERGVRRLALADDRRPAGASLADRVTRLAEAAGIRVVGRGRLDPADGVPEELGRDVRRDRAEAFLYTGAGGGFGAEVLRRVHAGAPGVALFGGDELTLLPGLAERVGPAGERLVVTALQPREAAAFTRRFAAAYGRRPGSQAVLGYDAMRLVLDAVRRAGAGASSRRAVIRQALESSRAPATRFNRYRVEGNDLVTVGRRL
jgi:branched-chain amino acid transport system substrate-binding protein